MDERMNERMNERKKEMKTNNEKSTKTKIKKEQLSGIVFEFLFSAKKYKFY
jgi:hypothetical protein